ncbi:MAG: hypothetical protein JKY56_14110 [Kofleriaceae bacterium]|nr:hypothetical protein [Kofleriaceae bacterium]
MLPLLFAHSAQLGPAQVDPSDPGNRFAHEVSQLADSGWTIGDLRSEEVGEQISLSLTMVPTMANSKQAEELSLVWDFRTQQFNKFVRHHTAMPSEARNYAFEAALLEELNYGAPSTIETGCADTFIRFGETEVIVSSDDYEVELSHVESNAGSTLASWLRRTLSSGELVDVRATLHDTGGQVERFVVLLVDGDEGLLRAKVKVNRQGKPLSFSVHHTPGHAVWRRYLAGAALANTLADGEVIRSLKMSEDDSNVLLTIKLGDGQQITIGESDFEDDDDGCGC